MTSGATIFRPMPGHAPRSQQDRHQRVHHYVSEMAEAASNLLKQALLALRDNADRLPPELKQLGTKEYTENEFLPAVKELLCIWIHFEAVDQGAQAAPSWLIHYLRLALHTSDYLITDPPAFAVMEKHAGCRTLTALVQEVSLTMANYLGYGEQSVNFAPALVPLLENTRALRQRILKESLTAACEDWQ